ncbi:MAG: DUF2244 domain-containing protein [Paracoccaceae bacterium]
MPYQYLPSPPSETHLHLWPHRSLPKRGFVWFIASTAILIAVPLLALIGNPALWVMLPFLMAAIAGVWWGLQRSYRDGEIVEDLRLTRDLITLTRHGPRGRRQDWQANPYWLRITLHPTAGPVPNYLTLKADGREVELGAFLSEEERIALRDDLQRRMLDFR